MIALILTPAVLAALALAAHFLRRGQFLPCAICVLAGSLVLLRRPWARRVLQALLALGAIVWARAGASLVSVRRAEGGPWVRLAVIMGAVTLVTAAAALLLETRGAAAHFRAPPRV